MRKQTEENDGPSKCRPEVAISRAAGILSASAISRNPAPVANTLATAIFSPSRHLLQGVQLPSVAQTVEQTPPYVVAIARVSSSVTTTRDTPQSVLPAPRSATASPRLRLADGHWRIGRHLADRTVGLHHDDAVNFAHSMPRQLLSANDSLTESKSNRGIVTVKKPFHKEAWPGPVESFIDVFADDSLSVATATLAEQYMAMGPLCPLFARKFGPESAAAVEGLARQYILRDF